MGLITPTTTMMREGISQVATKIDAGFRGVLNWSLRNGSSKDLIIGFGEPIFKLTIFKLEANELPEIPYGSGDTDAYQDAEGVVRSKRKIPADIPNNKLVSSSFAKLDPKKQLREAGYPFDHIGTELVNLHGKFELVSKDVLLLKDQFETRANQLTAKIESETQSISNRLDDFRKSFIEKVETIFERKFYRIVGVLIGAIPVMYAGVTFLQAKRLSANLLAFIAAIVGIAILTITFFLSKTSNRKGE